MKKTLLILCMMTYAAFANVGISAGAGVSSYKVPIVNQNRKQAKNYLVSVHKHYKLNPSDTLVLTSAFTTHRSSTKSLLSEIELQTSFIKQIKARHGFGFGFNITHILMDQFDSVTLNGNGFGLHAKYILSISNHLNFNIQILSNNYKVSNGSKLNNGNFSNQSVRMYLTFFPTQG